MSRLLSRLGIDRQPRVQSRPPEVTMRPQRKRGVIGSVDRSRFSPADFEPIRLTGRRAAAV